MEKVEEYTNTISNALSVARREIYKRQGWIENVATSTRESVAKFNSVRDSTYTKTVDWWISILDAVRISVLIMLVIIMFTVFRILWLKMKMRPKADADTGKQTVSKLRKFVRFCCEGKKKFVRLFRMPRWHGKQKMG